MEEPEYFPNYRPREWRAYKIENLNREIIEKISEKRTQEVSNTLKGILEGIEGIDFFGNLEAD